MKTIQLTPSCKDYLWGGEKLRTEYGIQSELHPLSEAWMLSGWQDSIHASLRGCNSLWMPYSVRSFSPPQR